MLLLEPFHITEPADAVAKRADGQLDHDIFIPAVVVVGEDRLPAALFVDDQAETDVKFLDAGHVSPGHGVGAVEDHAGVNVGEGNMIFLAVVGEQDADPFVEVELDPFHGVQHGDLRDFAVNAGLFGRRCRGGRRLRRRCGIDPDRKIAVHAVVDCQVVHVCLHPFLCKLFYILLCLSVSAEVNGKAACRSGSHA